MTELKQKVKNGLDESRILVPAAQVIIGFQFNSVFQQGFSRLPPLSQYLRLGATSLLLVVLALTVVPAAYHRIVEDGEDTERFHSFASRMLMAAMVTLGLAVTADFFVIVRKVLASTLFASISALLVLALFFGLWFGYTLLVKGRKPEARWV